MSLNIVLYISKLNPLPVRQFKYDSVGHKIQRIETAVLFPFSSE